MPPEPRPARATAPPPAPWLERLMLLVPALALLAVAAPWGRLRSTVQVVPVAEARPVSDAGAQRPASDPRRVLKVCADPNNLPFSNRRQEGFENRLAALVARDLGARVEYTWFAQRRGFIRNTLKAHQCDLVAGVPSSLEMVLATRPYYRSSYVFVTRRDAHLRVRSFDDSVLRRLRIGVHVIGDDYANAPPAHALTRRGMVRNVVGFSIYGDYASDNPPAQILDALADRRIDVAVVWGPLAGYFARRSRVPLAIVPVSPQIDVPFLPFVYDISMGVRRDDPGLRADVEGALDRHRAEVDAILDAYGVPRVGGAASHRS